MNDAQAANFYLSMGIVAATLIDPEAVADLALTLREGSLHIDYVRLVRDKLTQAIDDAAELPLDVS